jgi:hypothetical protein
MRRAIVIALSCCAFAAAPRPPSSIQPSAQPQLVTISHRHERVSACSDGGEHRGVRVCRALREEGDSQTTIRVRRVAEPKTTHASSELVVEFARQRGQQRRQVELAPGDWRLDWPAATGARRIRVGHGAAPSVSLHTTSGACRASGNKCELIAAPMVRTVNVTYR